MGVKFMKPIPWSNRHLGGQLIHRKFAMQTFATLIRFVLKPALAVLSIVRALLACASSLWTPFTKPVATGLKQSVLPPVALATDVAPQISSIEPSPLEQLGEEGETNVAVNSASSAAAATSSPSVG
ncbi:MAG: hypothetical protein ACTS5F_02045 [Candidatus Hodgkinia cicadicola]